VQDIQLKGTGLL